MNAVKFIEERNRMCGTMSEMWGVDAAQIVKNTEEWSAAHPLLEYLDTELTPEEIDMDHEAAEQLRQLCQGCDLDRLEELAEADKDGRVVVLPCKVGDTVYMIERIFDIDNGVRDEICARKVIGHGGNNLNKLWLIGSGGICNVSIFVSEFGKTVFLTHEEAKKALEERAGKKDG